MIRTGKVGGSLCDNKEQSRKVYFPERDAVTSLDIPRAPAKHNRGRQASVLAAICYTESMKCLVCKLSEVGEEDSYDKCSVCGRENDSWGIEDDEFGGANYFTINDHKELWKLYGARTWKVKDFNMIDRLACFIQEKFGINERNKSIAEYRRVVEECKELLSQASFDIRADIERRARENPTTPNAIFWLSMNLESK